ncbi:N-acetylmuramoyl-L-alanine amidase [Campylobacter curvus]|uniref:N-acetylmuramoyl-L-alanine amidase n=1 Tax=Campylobacter curvus TaxID=200 RepID=UPI00147061C5|nr:N-acetylmuramoyl-L-alanine amidase [Campylobacter curvus]
MTRIIFVVLMLAMSLFSANEAQIFSNFDRNFATSTKAQKNKFHNDIKQIYVQAIINNDKNLKKQTLSRLIISSKALGLDSSSYLNDLNELNGAKPAAKTNNLDTQARQTQTPIKQTLSTRPLYLLSATKNGDTLVLKFNQPLDTSKLKTSALNQKNIYRNIMDIEGVLNGSSLTYKNFITQEVRIAQFDKNTIRIIFSDRAQKTIKANVIGDALVISSENFVSNEKINAPLTKQPVKTQQSTPTPAAQTQSPKTPATPTSQPRPHHVTGGKTIVIDPGHGGSDPGAISGKMQEKVAVLAVGKKLGEILKKRGYKVYFTRSNDTFINLRTRTKYANDKMADLFVSIHANAAPNAAKAASMHGIETFFLSPARSERSKNAAALENKSDIEEMNYFSQQTFLNVLNREKIIASNKLGIDMQRELLAQARKVYSASDGGVREAPFWVLVGALMPAVLVEIGYITHPVEGKMLYDDAYQNALALGIANGVDSYFAKN